MCATRLETSSRCILLRFVEDVSLNLGYEFTSNLFTSPLSSEIVAVGDSSLQVVRSLDAILAYCCVVLAEPIPQPKVLNFFFSYKRN
jgi:hypothetical protein